MESKSGYPTNFGNFSLIERNFVTNFKARSRGGKAKSYQRRKTKTKLGFLVFVFGFRVSGNYRKTKLRRAGSVVWKPLGELANFWSISREERSEKDVLSL
jgi:hypothetical protein